MAVDNQKLGAAFREVTEKMKALQSASMVNAKERASAFATATVEALGAMGNALLDAQEENAKLKARLVEIESRMGIRNNG